MRDIAELDAQIEHVLMLIQSQKRDDITISSLEYYPRKIEVCRPVGYRVWDRFIVSNTPEWELTAQRFDNSHDRYDTDGSAVSCVPLMENEDIITMLILAIKKTVEKFTPLAATCTMGYVSFDPVPGESDYDI